MSAKTKIVVLRMRELIYTAIFVGLAILLVVIFLAMFRTPATNSKEDTPSMEARDTNAESHTNKKDSNTSTMTSATANGDADPVSYIPGIYTSSLALGNQAVDVAVTVSHSAITDIGLILLTDAVETMYPLMTPTMESLRSQILTTQNTTGITYEEGSKYTTYVLIQAIELALEKAKVAN